MSTVQEIAAAVDLLPADEKEELLRFLAVRLRKDRAQQPPHLDSAEEVATMAAEDEAVDVASPQVGSKLKALLSSGRPLDKATATARIAEVYEDREAWRSQ